MNADLTFLATVSKADVFARVKEFLTAQGYIITQQDENRPWGGFYYVSEDQKKQFAHDFYSGEDVSTMLQTGLKLTPKILIIQPGEILSWQWHERRGELWRLVGGQAGYMFSPTDEMPSHVIPLEYDKTVHIDQGMRHRLVGSTAPDAQWGVVAEIWEHSDQNNPSTEEDIHRLIDKYSRA